MQVLPGIVRTITTPLMSNGEWWKKRNNLYFTILYYKAEGSFKNRYGMDVINRLKLSFPGMVWISVGKGLNEKQMSDLYYIVDLYIRPSRWDGDPFMVREALNHGVPTISTFSSDKRNIKADPDNFIEWVKEIEKQYLLWRI